MPSSLVRTFAASPEETFDAWLDPLVMHRWLFVTPVSEIVEIDLCPRAGGRFSIIEQLATGAIDHRGRFDALVRPRRLAFTLDDVTAVSIDLAPCTAGCELTLRATEALERWDAMLDRLAAVLRGD